MDDKHLPETIYEVDENGVYERQVTAPHNKIETPNSCRKRTPLAFRNRRMRPQTSPSSQSQTSHSSPRSHPRDYRITSNLPTPSPRCVSNPFDQGGIVMSPSALSVKSNIGTPGSVKSGCGWTLEQRSAMFPAEIDDELLTTQYESPITDEATEKNKSDCQQWLDQADLTSPWNSTIPPSKKKHSRSRISSKSFTTRGMVDASTQTVASLPPDFNLFEFLEKHGASLQAFTSRENSLSGSANSSLRRKLFDCGNYSESDSDGDDFNPIGSPKYENHQSPKPNRLINPEPVTPSSEQFSSSPIKISPSNASTTTSPGALSCCGGANDFASPFQDESPYRSPFRSPFGDPNISLSPIPKSKLFPSANDNEHLPEEEPNAVRNLNFETTSNFDSDLDETALDYQTKKNQSKLISSSLENSLDVSMRSDSWDVSAIPKTGLGLGHVSHKNAESTHIHGYKSIEALKDDHLEEDVYMGSCSQESRGFSFCEPDEPFIEESNVTQTDSGISSAPNSRMGSVLHCEKQKSSNIPLPTFSTDVIYEDKY